MPKILTRLLWKEKTVENGKKKNCIEYAFTCDHNSLISERYESVLKILRCVLELEMGKPVYAYMSDTQ